MSCSGKISSLSFETTRQIRRLLRGSERKLTRPRSYLMMKNKKLMSFSRLFPTALLLMWSTLATAIEFDEIKDFGEVFEVSANANDRQRIEVSWKIADGYYLYNNKFLKFKTETAGVVLGEAEIPEGEKKFDELLGEEVIKFHGRLTVSLPLDSVGSSVENVSLKVRSQGCMEDVFCYPPTEQLLVVNLPAPVEVAALGKQPQAATTLADVFNQPLTGLGQESINK
jgi:thiol:disulfide interchange protein